MVLSHQDVQFLFGLELLASPHAPTKMNTIKEKENAHVSLRFLHAIISTIVSTIVSACNLTNKLSHFHMYHCDTPFPPWREAKEGTT